MLKIVLGQLSLFVLYGSNGFPLQTSERRSQAVELDITQAARVEIAEATGARPLGVAEAVGVGVQVAATVGVHVQVAQTPRAFVNASQLPQLPVHLLDVPSNAVQETTQCSHYSHTVLFREYLWEMALRGKKLF